MVLYIKQGCPFCEKVLSAAQELGVIFDLRDIADDAVVAELLEKGGKRQVPYLVDEERNVAMYESDDIVAYLHQHHSPAA